MLRISGALILSIAGLAAHAGPFDFVPAGSVRNAMNAGDFRRALDAFDQTPAGSKADRTAIRNLLLFKNGLPLTAVTSLVREVRPGQLHPTLLKLWINEINASPLVTDGLVPASSSWNQVVDVLAPTLRLNTKADVIKALKLADATPKSRANARARMLWQIANGAPLVGETDLGLRALDRLRELGQTAIKGDAISIAAARILYQRNDLEGALKALDEVPKSSSLWTEALEERVWTNLRRDDFDHALGGITTLLSPALDPLVGPEPFFLSNLMSLKTCDYPRLFKTSETFKKRHRDRLGLMQTLAATGTHPSLNEVFERFDKKGLSIDALGPLVAKIPRASLRDRKLRVAIDTRRILFKEATTATELKDERSSLFARKTAESTTKLIAARLRELAKLEVTEYRVMLNKMHILEAEVIERMNLDDNLKGKRSQLAKVEDKGDVLVFPYNSDEVWLDELDNYKARVKDCPTLKGAGL